LKHIVLITDGAAGLPMADQEGKTCLELAETPNLDAIAREAVAGMTRTVPSGMEPSSACACMSVMGYDPRVYYRGRSAIEAKSLGIPLGEDEVLFRCNLVALRHGEMWSYSAGYITTEEARELIEDLDKAIGNENIHFYPGVSYRHILKIKGHPETLQAECTPPHDISDKPVAGFLPKGPGSELLKDLMKRSEAVLRDHPVNQRRKVRGQIPSNTIWLFWSSGQIPQMPPFGELYGLSAAITSGVDLLKGLGIMADMEILDIPNVTDDLTNDFAGQASGGLEALKHKDLVVIHVEAPDEAGHAGSVKEKIAAIQKIDSEIVGRIREFSSDELRLMVMPDHPTPISLKTHIDSPVPFLLWGPGFKSNGALRFTEPQARETGLIVDEGCQLMGRFLRGAVKG
jgi:2,3-bisphosphoglycerate-independent phosphoglycerate mutase